MENLVPGINNAINYVESNIMGNLKIGEIAAMAYLSPYYFQRVFHSLCGMTIGEYIRKRRLTLAAEELSSSDAKVIDVALKYGYDSPDSFSRAFTKFHGISPSAAKIKGATLKTLPPLKINLAQKGNFIMEYRIVEKAAFTIVGFSRKFSAESAYLEVPKFWQEHYKNGKGEIIKGMFGACINSDTKEFDYLIADMYLPWSDIPESCVTKTFPTGTWVVFPYHGECPEALQAVNTQIWSEWLPNCKEYNIAGNYDLEVYFDETNGEIWLPVKKVSA